MNIFYSLICPASVLFSLFGAYKGDIRYLFYVVVALIIQAFFVVI